MKLSLISLVLVSVIACTSTEEKPRISVVLDGEPITLDPNNHREALTRSVLANCFEGLVAFDSVMNIVPLLALSWENPDDLTWIFHLRPGVRFHNGQMLDARVVVDNFRRFVSDTTRKGLRLSSLDTVYSHDSLTVAIRTSRPDPVLLNQLTMVYMVSDSAPLSFPCDTGRANIYAGTGPYVVDFWRSGRMRLRCWDGYWGPKVRVGTLDLLFRHGHRGTMDMLRRGEADMAVGLGFREAREVLLIKGFRLERRPGLAMRYLRIRPLVHPYKHPLVRRAISLAIDRSRLVDSIAGGFGRPASQMATEAVFGYNPELPVLAYDPDSARALLAAAGYRHRRPALILDVMDKRRDLGAMIAQQLKAAGFDCSLCVHPREEFYAGSGRTSYFFLSAITINSGDASSVISLGLRTPEFSWISEPRQRQRALQQSMAEFTARYEFIPLFSEDILMAVSDRVVWQPRQDMMVLGKDMDVKSRKYLFY